jgi:mono/diheme cytochrome c family protein
MTTRASHPDRSSAEGLRHAFHLSLLRRLISLAFVAACAAVALGVGCYRGSMASGEFDPSLVAEGKQTFRFNTFGDETFWTDTLRMHEVIRSAVTPTIALSVGLKLDVDALPQAVRDGLAAGTVDLKNPATTVTLLKLGAVVGLIGQVDANNTLTRVGVTCAMCHSTVDNSFAPGIGKRLDGWPNLSLNVGAIIALSPALTPAQKAVYGSWGPGRYDPRYNRDGLNGAVQIPPIYGLAGIHRITATGDGPDPAYWNRYVGVTQMHGHGVFSEPRLSLNVRNLPDQLSGLVPALQQYELSLSAPRPAASTFDDAAAERGRVVFNGAGTCASCHTGALLTDANARLHAPSDVVSEPEAGGAPSYASRSASKMYRTTPLRALSLHPPYFHNGAAKTLESLVDLYSSRKALNLTAGQKADLVQYLKSQ